MELAGLYFNPNIHPKEEFDKRKGAVLTMAEDYGVPVSVNELNMLDYWRDSLALPIRANAVFTVIPSGWRRQPAMLLNMVMTYLRQVFLSAHTRTTN